MNQYFCNIVNENGDFGLIIRRQYEYSLYDWDIAYIFVDVYFRLCFV